MIIALILLLNSFQEGRLSIEPTVKRTVFDVKYSADMSWNVEVTLLNEKGKKKFNKTIKNSDGFIMPLNLDGEDSGTYTVEIFTPAYNLVQSFEYLTWQDELKEAISITYNQSNNLLRIDSNTEILLNTSVYIYNEKGDKLIEDNFSPPSRLIRAYNLGGAPATKLEVIVSSLSSVITIKKFDF
ncbi:MAG: hypothetical protein RIC03_05200 [Cyclobacteriaceae bacterium]